MTPARCAIGYFNWVADTHKKKNEKYLFTLAGGRYFSFMKYIFDKEKNVVRQIIEKKDKDFKKPETGYWVRLPEKWWRGALSGLKPVERCLLISLKVWGSVAPSTNKLAQELGITWRTADKGLKSLKQKGFLPSAKKQK
jgi:hypothetical protein